MRLHKEIICYFFLARFSLVKSVIITDEDPSNLSIKLRQVQPAPEPIGEYNPCPFGHSPTDYDYTASWCNDIKTLVKKCVQRGIEPPEVPDVRYKVIRCIPLAYCVGSGQRDVNPRWARCYLNITKPLKLLTQKVKSSSILQCVNLRGNVVQNADGLGAQVQANGAGEPQMPLDALIFYQGSASPIEAVSPSGMNLMSGYVTLTSVIDYKQPLQFCINILAAGLVFKVGYLNPKLSTLQQDSTFLDTNVTVFYKRYDDTTGNWFDTQLDTDDLATE